MGGLHWSLVKVHLDGARRLSSMTMSLRGESFARVQEVVAGMLSSTAPSGFQAAVNDETMQARVCEESDASITVTLERRASLA